MCRGMDTVAAKQWQAARVGSRLEKDLAASWMTADKGTRARPRQWELLLFGTLRQTPGSGWGGLDWQHCHQAEAVANDTRLRRTEGGCLS